MSRLLLIVIFLAGAGLVMLPILLHPQEIAYQSGVPVSDLESSHLASSLFIQRAIATWQQIPLWNPTLMAGIPLTADPLSGFWYLPNWLAHLRPALSTYNLLFYLHLAWAGLGMTCFLINEGRGQLAALLGGIAFCAMPRLSGALALGHVSLVFALAWTPWLALALGRGLEALRNDSPTWLRDAALAAAHLALIFLIDPRWFPLAAIFASAYCGRWLLRQSKIGRLPWRRLLFSVGLGAAICLALISALALPLLEFVQRSSRIRMSSAEQAFLSLPVEAALGAVFPTLGGYPEWLIYPGIGVFLLAVVAVVGGWKEARFWAIFALLMLGYALGPITPIFGWIHSLVPGMNLLRVPSRSLFLVGFFLPTLAALGVDGLIKGQFPEAGRRRIRLAVIAVGFFVLLLTALLAINPQRRQGSMAEQLAGVALMTTLSALIILRLSGNQQATRRSLPGWGLVLIVLIELVWIDRSLLVPVPPAEAAFMISDIPGVCLRDHENPRLYSPSFAIPLSAAARHGLQLAEGINPLQLEAYVQVLGRASGFNPASYDTALPPRVFNLIDRSWAPDLDARQLGWLGISCVVTDQSISGDLNPIEGYPEFFHNPHCRPRAWIEADQALNSETWQAVDDYRWSPNSIWIEARGPGSLVLSEIDYPGWVVIVDGRRTVMGSAYDVLRSVRLTSGDHQVEFHYRPWSVYLGLILHAAALAALAVLVAAGQRNGRLQRVR